MRTRRALVTGWARRFWLGVCVIGVVAAAVAVERPVEAVPSEPLPASYSNPVLDLDAADPFITRVGNTYYAFATQYYYYSVPVRSSTDLVTWSAAGNALPQLGSWATWGSTWAPAVLRRVDASGNGYWVMYYTAKNTASGDQCIGTAVSYDAPIGGGIVGPYEDDASQPFVCQVPLDGSIDATVYVPTPGGTNPQAYLFWKSNEAALDGHRSIWAQALDPSGLGFVAGSQPIKVMTSEPGWENMLVEGPTVYWDAASQQHILLYSACRWDQPCYATGWATCNLVSGVFTSCTRGQTGVQSEPFMSANADTKGPGGAEVFTDAAGYPWLVYHAYKASQCTATSCSGARQMRVDRLCTLNGVPRTDGPTVGSRPFARSADCLQDVDSFGWGASAGGLPVKGGWDMDSSSAAKEVSFNGPWPNQSVIFRGNPNLGNQTARVEAQWAATGPTSAYPKYGMLALFTDWNNHVQVWLDKKNGLLASYAKVGGVAQGWVNTSLPGFDFTVYHELKVVKTGTTVQIYLDGTLRQTRTLNLAGGQTGLITEDTKANFRNATQT